MDQTAVDIKLPEPVTVDDFLKRLQHLRRLGESATTDQIREFIHQSNKFSGSDYSLDGNNFDPTNALRLLNHIEQNLFMIQNQEAVQSRLTQINQAMANPTPSSSPSLAEEAKIINKAVESLTHIDPPVSSEEYKENNTNNTSNSISDWAQDQFNREIEKIIQDWWQQQPSPPTTKSVVSESPPAPSEFVEIPPNNQVLIESTPTPPPPEPINLPSTPFISPSAPPVIAGTGAATTAAVGTGATAIAGTGAATTAAVGTGATAIAGTGAATTAAVGTGATAIAGTGAATTAAVGTGAVALGSNPVGWVILGVGVVALLSIMLVIIVLLIGPEIGSLLGPSSMAASTQTSVGGKAGGGKIIENPYIGLTKTASPTTATDPTTITYTYTITAKLEDLTNIQLIDETVKILQSENSPPPINLLSVAPTPPTTLTKGEWWTSPPFSINATWDNALVTNHITITATTVTAGNQTIKSRASTIIGDPPTGCFLFAPPPAPNPEVIAVNWEDNPSTALEPETVNTGNIMGAFSDSASFCNTTGNINLYLAESGCDITYGGWYLKNNNIAIDFKTGSIGSAEDSLHTLAHESGHVYAENSGIIGSFIASNLVVWNSATETCEYNIYPYAAEYIHDSSACYSENFAQGFYRYIKGDLPANWQSWFGENVFN